MSKAVLMSIQPKWCELIASGKKTVEVRKTKPKLDVPFKVYIYQTRKRELNGSTYSDGKVIGEFVCDNILEIGFSPYNHGEYICQDQTYIEQSCVPFEKMFDYFGEEYGYGWHISNLVIYNKPKELGEFKKAGFLTEEDWLAYLYPNTHCHYEAWAKRFNITKPPQSWMYVEDDND